MFPDGYFINGLLFFGKSLSKETYLAKGVRLEVPDLRTAGLDVLQELWQGNSRLLTALFANKMAMQIQWSVEDDFHAPLTDYSTATDSFTKSGRMTRWASLNRQFRHKEAQIALDAGLLKRERVHLYFGLKCNSMEAADLTSLNAYETYLRQQAVNFDAKLNVLNAIFPTARIQRMGDREHCQHYRRVLNPSMATRLSGSIQEATHGFREDKSILQNCLRSDAVAFKMPRHDGAVGITLDGMHHTVFVMRDRPAGTRMGDLLPLLSSVSKGVTVVFNIYPQDIEREIEMTRAEREEWLKYVNDPKSYGAADEVKRLGDKISFLQRREILPFRVLWTVKVCAPTIDELNTRSLAVKTALSALDGLEYHQVNEPTQATNLFHETLPGWLGSDYRDWDVYWENKNLRDVLPISSSFTGHLDEQPMAIYHTPAGGLCGVRLTTSNGTPQHTVVVGVNGSGKTATTIDLLTQASPYASYQAIFEEGLAYATYAQLNGLQSIVPRAGSNYTLNPFDTLGLPLSDENFREINAVCVRLIGRSKDEDRQKTRESLIGEYVTKLFFGAAKSFLQEDEARAYEIARRALLLSKRLETMPGGSSQIDAFTELRDLAAADPGRVDEMLSALTEEQIVTFANDPATKSEVMKCALAAFKPEQYPQFSQLWSLMKNGRMAHHKSVSMSEELDRLVSGLARGKAVGGTVGAFIDGVTNVKLDGAGIHVDYSFLQDGELKEIAGFVFPARVRQYIITRPRAELKLVVWEELRRLLRMPNAKEDVKETLAQFRKYKACALLSFQEASQIEEIDPALLDLILNQSKQFLFLRQNSKAAVDRMGDVIGLPEAARQAILDYELVEHQKGSSRGAFMTLFSREGSVPVCGTLVNRVNPYMLYVASSNGDTFDQRARALNRYSDVFDGVVEEVDKQLEAKSAKPRAA
ncbi:hypothetical protein [Oleiharenicola sp. Vm1]|uniref:hypothetical protein n=1 Tax=Oleiharenicola sp. Vm1 TaxID=3398393 RepID=UPI0039F4AA11